MSDDGWIKLDRKILNWRWYKDANTMRVFIHLLLTASFADNWFESIEIHRGEAVVSYEGLANTLNLSVQNVRTAIKHLKSTGEVTAKPYAKFQVISIVNYDLYQGELTGRVTGNQQAANRQLTGSQQHYKKVKNVISKEGKNSAPAAAECYPGDAPEWQKRGFESEAEYLAYLRK